MPAGVSTPAFLPPRTPSETPRPPRYLGVCAWRSWRFPAAVPSAHFARGIATIVGARRSPAAAPAIIGANARRFFERHGPRLPCAISATHPRDQRAV